MDWQRNFVFDCLAGRAGLEAPISVDSETALMPVVMTHLPPRHRPFDHFRFRLAYPWRLIIPTSLLHRRAASDGLGFAGRNYTSPRMLI